LAEFEERSVLENKDQCDHTAGDQLDPNDTLFQLQVFLSANGWEKNETM
jgi:hypothetical protein